MHQDNNRPNTVIPLEVISHNENIVFTVNPQNSNSMLPRPSPSQCMWRNYLETLLYTMNVTDLWCFRFDQVVWPCGLDLWSYEL